MAPFERETQASKEQRGGTALLESRKWERVGL